MVSPRTPVKTAGRALHSGLRHVSDASPGISRERRGKRFAYRRPDGRALKDPAALDRIRHLAIPPAWTEVWICPTPHGHIQATGRDARGRKQYRYHDEWRLARDATKFDRMVDFGRALPLIRQHVARDLQRPPLSRLAVLATIVRLLEKTLIRVGNEEYARANGSYGLTTLRNRHVTVKSSTLRFHFRGKSGKVHEIELHDRRLAVRLRQIEDLPGQELFHYRDELGGVHPITSTDVNEYLHAIAGEQFSAKDFRTWAGTLAAACVLSAAKPRAGQRHLSKQQINAAVECVADQLGNTPAICRKSYIHPAIIEGCREGIAMVASARGARPQLRATGLSAPEKSLLRFLRRPRPRRPLVRVK